MCGVDQEDLTIALYLFNKSLKMASMRVRRAFLRSRFPFLTAAHHSFFFSLLLLGGGGATADASAMM